MQKEKKIFFSCIIVVILINSIFFGIIEIQINTIAEKDDDKQELEVTIIVYKSSGTPPLKVSYKPLVLNYDGEVKYYWDFGDGSQSNEKNPSYTYKEKGDYICKLTVKDSSREKNDSLNVIVFPNNPPKVKIVCDTTANRPATIEFDAEVFDPEGEELSYWWVVKYPPFLGVEKNITSDQKSFSHKFWRNGMYVAELTVTDESGIFATDYEIIQIQPSQIEQIYGMLNFIILIKSPAIIGMIWSVFEEQFSSYLDENWLDMPDTLQNLILKLLDFGNNIDYEPPIPQADLLVSDIGEFNHSNSINSSGAVTTEVCISNSLVIENNDSINVAKNVYLTLKDPLSDNKGLPDEIGIESLTVSIDIGGISKQIFYNGEYKEFTDCVLIDNLANGDISTGEITVTMNIADSGTFKNNEIYTCNLYVYQEKADFVEAIPFEIVT